MQIRILLFLLTLCCAFSARASHIVGGEIFYDYLGNNNYRITVYIYRDCFSNGAGFDSPLPVSIYNASNQLVQTVNIPFPGSQNLPVVFNNPCVSTPGGICVERAIYTTVINLPPTPGGYTVSHQRCCRGPNITNLQNPDDTGLTLSTRITGTNSNALVNSSPRFANYPPLVLCNNDDLIFNHAASDPDGDDLTYELITPNSGANGLNPAPNPTPPPPYAPVAWGGGFSAAVPLGPGSSITINPQTGLLVADPELLGLFVVGIRVREFRNGVQIGQTDRDFLFRVVNCVINLQADITPQEELPNFISYCQGTSITFDNQSFGGSQYQWDFGVPGITTDVSTQFEPTYTFPAPGVYTVTLVVNPGWPCSDTSTSVFQVYDNLTANYTANDLVCQQGNSIDFDGTIVGPAGTTVSWDFGPNATPQTATTLDVSGVNFNQSGYIPVTMTAVYETCEIEVLDSILIYAEPDANFTLPPAAECGGLEVSFVNQTQNGTSFSWDFGVPGIDTDVSTGQNPTYLFPEPGTYTVTLVANSNAICQDTFQLDVTVNDALVIDFISEDTVCITDNSLDFIGIFSGPPGSVLSWDFGPNASIQTANTQDVLGVSFLTAGIQTVTFTASFGNCSDTETKQILITREPTVDFSLADGLKCAPFTAQFTNLASADSPMTYLWDFGDGTTSTQQNPTHIYTEAGFYDVSLTVQTSVGCISTITETKPNYVDVKPSPVSKFIVSPAITDICNPTISFTDQSTDGYLIQYEFDEIGAVSSDKNPTYDYTASGTFNPIQIATNEFLCKDTSRMTVIIYPNAVFIPNTFTPDGNEFNGVFNAVVALENYGWELKVYNRWGELVFFSNDPKIGWDGTYNGQLVQSGLYVYRFRYINCENQDIWLEEKGHVNLMR